MRDCGSNDFGTPSSFSMRMNELITQINDALWGYVLIGALVAAGLWSTWKTEDLRGDA